MCSIHPDTQVKWLNLLSTEHPSQNPHHGRTGGSCLRRILDTNMEICTSKLRSIIGPK